MSSLIRFYSIPRISVFTLVCGLFLSSLSIANTQIHYEKALSAFNQSQFDESMIHLKNALKSSPENLPSKILMGKLLTQLGRTELAKVEFEEAIIQGADVSSFASHWAIILFRQNAFEKIIQFNQFENFSKDQQVDWLRIKSSACLKIKNYQCARASFIAIGELTSDPIEKLNGLAQVELAEKNYKDANLTLDKAIKINPEQAKSWQLKGLVAKAQKDIPSAIDYMQRAFDLSPDDPLILRHLADVYLASNRKEKAQQTINSILVASPDDPFAILVNSWLQQDTELEAAAEAKFKQMAARIANLPNEYVEKEESLLFLRALVSFRQQQFDNAVRDFSLLRKLDQTDLTPIILLAKSYIAIGNEKKAIEVLEENETLLNVLPDSMAMLGDLYINSGKNFKALSLLQELSQQHPSNLQLKLLEAKLLIARGKPTEGMVLIESLLSEHPHNPTVLFVHCIFSLQNQAFIQAEESISKLLKLQPNDPLKLNIKGAVLIKLGDIDRAQEFIQQALSILPSLPSAKLNLASTYFLQKQFDKSESLLTELLDKDPKYIPALQLLATIQTQRNEWTLAANSYKKVLYQDRQNVAALEGLVNIYVQQNELNMALNQLNKLRKINNTHPKYVIQKAQIYVRLKDQENAQNQIQTLEKLAQDNAPLLIALSKLQVKNNDLNGAINALSKAQSLQPKSLPLGVQFAELLLDNHKTTLAAEQIASLTERFTHSVDVIFLQARLAEQQGQLETANQLYAEVLIKHSEYDLALGKMYALLSHGVSHELFVTTINQIVKNAPNRFFPRNLLAQYHYYQENVAQAATHYEQLLAHPELPNKAAMLARLANVYMSSDKVKSKEYAEQAYALDKTDPQILTTLGWLLSQQQQPSEGLALLRKAAARGYQHPSIHYYIAVSLHKLKLNQEAKLELERLINMGTQIPELDQAKTLYNKL